MFLYVFVHVCSFSLSFGRPRRGRLSAVAREGYRAYELYVEKGGPRPQRLPVTWSYLGAHILCFYACA